MRALPEFDTVYRAEFAYVWASLRRLGVRPADIEDACHELFVVVHRKLGAFDTARPLRPWLLGIAYRVASEFRRRKHTRDLSLDDRHASDGIAADAAVAVKEQQLAILRALAAMPIEQRSVLSFTTSTRWPCRRSPPLWRFPWALHIRVSQQGAKHFAAAMGRAQEVDNG